MLDGSSHLRLSRRAALQLVTALAAATLVPLGSIASAQSGGEPSPGSEARPGPQGSSTDPAPSPRFLSPAGARSEPAAWTGRSVQRGRAAACDRAGDDPNPGEGAALGPEPSRDRALVRPGRAGDQLRLGAGLQLLQGARGAGGRTDPDPEPADQRRRVRDREGRRAERLPAGVVPDAEESAQRSRPESSAGRTSAGRRPSKRATSSGTPATTRVWG